VVDRQGDGALRLAAQVGVGLSASQLGELERFWRLLLTWNARINLTGARTEADLVGDHLPDALAMTLVVPPGARVVDVGSGGGLPGIPFALLRPRDPLTLVEPRAKRVAFLRTAVRELGLTWVQIVSCRLEGLSGVTADVASSRATFPPAEWLERSRVLAPRTLVFAARRADVEAGPGWRVEAERVYAAGAGQPRWLGLHCST
jgi:16S rRNA (guanine527-N7)-methyltransferase